MNHRWIPVCGHGRRNEAGAPSPMLSKPNSKVVANNATAILDAAANADRRSFFEVFRGTRHLADAEIEPHALRQHLIVEDEVIGVFRLRQLED
jgi:hypothetical protein